MTQVIYPTTNQEDSDTMGNWGRLFSKASNAIVEASDLAQRLDHANSEMEQLRSEVQRVLALNETLANELHEVRTDRDEARAELARANDTIARVQRELETETQITVNLRQDIDGLRRTLSDQLSTHEAQIHEVKERHRQEVDGLQSRVRDREYELMSLHDEYNKVRAKLENIQNILSVVQPQSENAPVQSVA